MILRLLISYAMTLILALPGASAGVQNDGVEVGNDFGGDIRGVDNSGDPFNAGFPNPDQTERNLSAFFGEMFSEGNQVVTDDSVTQNRERIDQGYKAGEDKQKEDDEARAALNSRVEQENEAKEAKAKADAQASLERRRGFAQQRYELHERAAGKDGWTEEEIAESERLWAEWIELEQFTPEEKAEQARSMAVHLGVVDDINRIAMGLGGTSAEDRAERRQTFDEADAATRTWRNATFTGNMVNQVAENTFSEREKGIFAKNKYEAARIYLQQDGLTDEQIKIAERIRDRNYAQMGYSAEAISTNTSLVLAGTASDVGLLGLGRPAAWVGNKVSGAVTGAAAKTEAAATTATTTATTTQAGTQTGARAAGTEAGTQAGARAAGTEAGNTTQVLNQAQRQAASQAYNDAKAAEAVARGGGEGAVTMEQTVGNTVLLQGGKTAVAGETTAAASGSSAAGSSGSAASQALTPAEQALFQPGVNLTESQIAQKIAIMKSGRAPTQTVDQKTYASLHQSMMKNFPDWRLEFFNRFLNASGRGPASAGSQSASSGASSGAAQALEDGATVIGK